MTQFRGVDAEAVASLFLHVLPDLSVMVFTRELRVESLGGSVPTRDELAGSALQGLFAGEALPPAHWRICEPLFRAALQGESSSAEVEATGRGRSYVVRVEPLRASPGAVSGGVCFWRDVTQRKRLVEELEQRARLMDLAHDAIIVREPVASAVTYWNREATAMYGYRAEEAQGQITHDLLATRFPESREAVDQALLERGRWEGELSHQRADGRRILVSSRQALVRGKRHEPLAVIELNADITESKRAEEELRAAEERFRRLIESAPDAMVIVNQDGVIELVNAQAEQLFSYSQTELIGQPVEMLLPMRLRERHARHREGFVAHPRARPMGVGMDLLARRKDGGEFAVEISLSPLHTESGLLISGAVRDISQQLLNQLEQALVPRIKIPPHWRLAWRYHPAVRSMLLGGDFIGACERRDGSLALLIGDVAGHGVAAAGTGATLRAAWLGAAQGDVPLESIPLLLHRLLTNQTDHRASTMATACFAEVDRDARELRLIRAGHDAPLLITPGAVSGMNGDHGPALGLSKPHDWPLQRLPLPAEAAIMLFTDGLTERRVTPTSVRRFDELAPHLEADKLLAQPPGEAIDELIAQLFPGGTEQLDDDVAVILLNLG
ncbi:MAG: PAS domain S-box protein [Solirubrobacterales bacterium]|nr:PAS domain S-box protein [Solirubrobacterales bacterium]